MSSLIKFFDRKIQRAILLGPRRSLAILAGKPREFYLGVVREMPLRRTAKHERVLLAEARRLHSTAYERQVTPLVSVTIATYNRAQLLVERAITSVLKQTYQNFEIVIVGDHCTDDTEVRLQQLNDPRIRFYNLPERGKYPDDPEHQWMVAGTDPINLALDKAQGSWIAHLDDDDIFEPHHLSIMLDYAQKQGAELVYSKMWRQLDLTTWLEIGGAFGKNSNKVPHSTVIFRKYLTLFKFDSNAWKLELPADHHLWLRMRRAGVRVGFVDQLTANSPLRPNTTQYEVRAEDRS